MKGRDEGLVRGRRIGIQFAMCVSLVVISGARLSVFLSLFLSLAVFSWKRLCVFCLCIGVFVCPYVSPFALSITLAVFSLSASLFTLSLSFYLIVGSETMPRIVKMMTARDSGKVCAGVGVCFNRKETVLSTHSTLIPHFFPSPPKHKQAQEYYTEAELLSECSHINIAQLHGICVEAPTFYMVMEYAAGGPLSSLLCQHTLEPSVIVDWALQIARGMNYLHAECRAACVVHRDLKSSNILLAQVSCGNKEKGR